MTISRPPLYCGGLCIGLRPENKKMMLSRYRPQFSRFVGLTLTVSLIVMLVPVGLWAAESAPAAQGRSAEPTAPSASAPKNPDPWEGMNRKIFAFNEFADKYALKPAAKGYKKVTPSWLDDSITRIFENMRDLRSSVNNVLQWEWSRAGNNFGRFMVNSTMGVGGMFDVATSVQLRKYPDDLGSTLAVWGVGEGPFLMLPFFGPSNVRDAAVIWPEDFLRPYHYIDHTLTRYSVTAVYVLDVRADLLNFESAIVGDRYSFIRDFYIQNRRMQAGEEPPPDDFGSGASDGASESDWDDEPTSADDGW